MRPIHRSNLPPNARRLLNNRTSQVVLSPDPSAEANRLWPQQAPQAFQAVRDTLKRMAQRSPTGAEFCMYCALDAGTEVDHFRPKATFPTCAPARERATRPPCSGPLTAPPSRVAPSAAYPRG